MNKLLLTAITIAALAPAARAASVAGDGDWISRAAATAARQLALQADEVPAPGVFPRNLNTDFSIPDLEWHLEIPCSEFKPECDLREHPGKDNYMKVRYVKPRDWTSGFFPGSLWLAYELTGDKALKEQAAKYTNMLLPVSYMTDTHDLGFMVNCPYGNAQRLAPNDSIKEVIVRTADNLIGRFDPKVGAIRSWDFGPWNYPVIIDNMMNLQLLFNASRITGDKKYTDIAVRHALKTIDHHFRPDYTSYHVVSYTPDGGVERRQTFQGKADESAWSRGQGWALYGYTEAYRETRRPEFLRQAEAIADMIIKRNNTEDLIPYWDFDAKPSPRSPRDASAAAVIASGLLELSTFAKNGTAYRDYAERILTSLASPAYLAEPGTNGGFVLKHSTGSLPHGSEIDTPLNYADYYFLEALTRLRRLQQGKPAADWARVK
ncbi:MAG: glycoside hydrolase family 88 protein [Bacteroides sp.]|nr:glycoside hydrolase family 88 protein [Bacteroides sp.]MCM1095318.1 glycoside hydrolase family 88 protein [Terasakiella sp.]